MKKKINIKILFCMFAFVLGAGALSFGVYSAVTLALNFNAKIVFNPNDVYVLIDGSVEGSMLEVEPYSINSAGTNSVSSWDMGNLSFSGEIGDKIIINLKITNFSYFTAKATLSGLPASNSNYSVSSINSPLTLAAYEEGMLPSVGTIKIKFELLNRNNLNLSINPALSFVRV